MRYIYIFIYLKISFIIFKGALAYVKIYKDPRMAAEQCKTDFQVCFIVSINSVSIIILSNLSFIIT